MISAIENSGPKKKKGIPTQVLTDIDTALTRIDEELTDQYPGLSAHAQPIHTAYISAADATFQTPAEWGATAISLLDEYADVFIDLGDDETICLVKQRLLNEPIQDLRLDFEDGYGHRGDDVEDSDAIRAGQTLSTLGLTACGIRVKALTTTEWRRALRTLELVLDHAGGVPPGFVFTVPKLRAASQVSVVAQLCEALEAAHGLPPRTMKFELQIESPQAIVGPSGAATLAQAIHRSEHRCTGLHYGTYDYSAACGIAPQHQALNHPVADHAKAVMLAATAQTGVHVADGSTNIVPEGTNTEVTQAIQNHYRLVARSLEHGYYQGWDIHAGQLATRWLATFTFFRTALAAAAPRIQAYLERRGGRIVDEPATAEALAAVVLRGLNCGAFTVDHVRSVAPDATMSVLQALQGRELL